MTIEQIKMLLSDLHEGVAALERVHAGHTPHRGRGGSPLPPARTGRDGPQETAAPTTKRVSWGVG